MFANVGPVEVRQNCTAARFAISPADKVKARTRGCVTPRLARGNVECRVPRLRRFLTLSILDPRLPGPCHPLPVIGLEFIYLHRMR
ncbi:hypothetical protein KM043_006286 [Ampulex compressa]|nr:hypothetical protein KM043_006286 [Ampulex compressa]